MLAHGTPVPRLGAGDDDPDGAVPEVRGPDGAALAALLRPLL
jgi:hypothetical protein